MCIGAATFKTWRTDRGCYVDVECWWLVIAGFSEFALAFLLDGCEGGVLFDLRTAGSNVEILRDLP
jgi:hypothetical protein